jgi:hypothetical protein
MPRLKRDDRLLDLAKRGAQAQLNDLLHEIKLLLGLFPHLRDSIDRDELPISFLLKKGARKAEARKAVKAAGSPGTGKKRHLSAAARLAISNAQKKRWAAYKAAKKDKRTAS